MFNSKALTEKWNPVLSHEGAGAIKDNYRKAVTAGLLENTESQLREERGMIMKHPTQLVPLVQTHSQVLDLIQKQAV